MSGFNLKDIKSLLASTGLEVIVSGGISSLQDVKTLKGLKIKFLRGVIIGRALYEGKINLKEALEL
jgi:phosphoribosylformimino-5-aminoimidazole carboxamide ribotide isomerase